MLRAREERTPVEVPSRMKVDAAWIDICIHNMSSRGLMASAAMPPAPRQYVEIRRGSHVIVGKVIWRKGTFFGLRSQDRIDIQAIVREPRLAKRPGAAPVRRDPERRVAARVPTPAERARRAERSRSLGAIAQFVFVAGGGAAAACTLSVLAYRALAVPFVHIAAYLAQ